MKNLITSILLFFVCCGYAQTVGEIYRKPLKEVIKEIESRFKVEIKYDEKLISDKYVDYVNWRYRNDIEPTLYLILGPQDMVFSKIETGVYQIEAFQYHRRPVEEGRKHLEHLSSLYSGQVEWEARKKELQTCIREQLKISPFPEFKNLGVIYSKKRLLNGYFAENVAVESLPGVYVSGTLYRPAKGKGPFPAIMVAQGHGETQHYGESSQLLSATLARMGAIVFSYDMFAKGEESLQFAFADHRTTMAPTMQAINSTKVLDFLSLLPEVDHSRIAMTGASGGGTQTFLLTALDERIAVSAPVVMVSSWFFGGCPCESGLPFHSCGTFGTNNAEIAAMAAPHPMLVVSDGGDWTANVPEMEFPFIKRIYGFYGKSESVENVHLLKEGHDYGPSKRQAVYKFFAKQLKLNLKSVSLDNGDFDESKSIVESKNAMLVFGEKGEKLPKNAIHGLSALKQLLKTNDK
jgi:Dipeptidyl aminopeptidases/acylaminoacyl-peptidases